MDATTVLAAIGALVVALAVLDVAALHWGADLREQLGDDRRHQIAD